MNDSSAANRGPHPDRGARPDHAHLPSEWITAADLMAGATIPIRLHLNVTLRPDSPQSTESGQGANSSGRRAPVTLERRLRKHTAKLLEWAKDDAENASVLLMDPLTAAGYAGVKLSPTEQQALAERVRVRSLGDMLPPGVELVTLRVMASTEPRAGSVPPKKPRKEGRTNE